MKHLYAIVVALLALLVLAGYNSTRDANIQIDPNVRFQTMRGWEVTARLWEVDKALNGFNPGWEQYGDEIFDRLVNEAGINRIRLGIPSGVENPVDNWGRFVDRRIDYKTFHSHLYEKINDNTDPATSDMGGFQFSVLDYQIEKFVLPIKKRIEANGENLFVNFCYMDFDWSPERGSLEHALHPGEFAEFILVHFEHLRDKYGIVPDAFEVILEPDNTTYWRGDTIARGLRAAVAALGEHGFSPEVIAPSTAHLEKAPEYIDAMLEFDGSPGPVDTLSYHRYGYTDKATRAVRAEFLTAIRERAERLKLDTAMLEHVKGDIDELIEDLTLANASAWQQFGIATNHKDNGAYFYILDSETRRIRPARRSFELAAVFRQVRMNAVRIQASSDSHLTDAVAFVNPDGRHVAIVRQRNPLDTSVKITGLPAGRYTLEFTPSGKSSEALGDVRLKNGQVLAQRTSGKGVLVVHQKL
jgi:O-glycosyl hydrolase